ncbi:glycoside hydrolase [Trichodelitschia bisporula]|uniref:Glycoside hydrolase n=1 Tax=Trichodelitschia bisporula TaxID=703511 RepID=A0A6G1HSS0_9PEZI|nr:glycoside hydrolase [Trichodelitschia bisporula]
MPPLPPPATPRLIVYQQTHHTPTGTPVSLLPLLAHNTGITHVYIAAIHLNDGAGNITLNDHAPSDTRYTQLWAEVKTLQAAGVRVLGMLGGAAKGSFTRLAQDFDAYYPPLRALVRTHAFDGLDLDVEERTPLSLMTRLIATLRADFGPSFLITLSPVLPALLPLAAPLTSLYHRMLHPEAHPPPNPLVSAMLRPELLANPRHISGFNYLALGVSGVGKEVAWFNVQHYCGWGDAGSQEGYRAIVAAGWEPERVVLAVLTDQGHGNGWVEEGRLGHCVRGLRGVSGFGGVAGWEYYKAGCGEGCAEPWEWVRRVGGWLRGEEGAGLGRAVVAATTTTRTTTTKTEIVTVVEGDPQPLALVEQDIQWLMEMGVDRERARWALLKAEGNADQAACLLFPEE